MASWAEKREKPTVPVPGGRRQTDPPCPSCGNGGIYAHCCQENGGRTVRQACKTCKADISTGEPDCACFRRAVAIA